MYVIDRYIPIFALEVAYKVTTSLSAGKPSRVKRSARLLFNNDPTETTSFAPTNDNCKGKTTRVFKRDTYQKCDQSIRSC